MGIIQALMARKWILYGFLAALILGIVYVVLPTKPNQTASAAETSPNPGVFSGNLALDITVIDREGNEVSLSDFRGRPVFLNFFATWCGPCKYEMPFMEKIWREYQEMGSDLVYLVVDVAENQETVEKYYRDNFYTMPYFLDPNGKAFSKYLFRGIPGSIFINRDGVIVARYNEALPEATIRKNIELITK
ncbi:MAG: TlpA family protein disulfide reductase [Bacillota bacterium]|nr:TlpA disulfide reductase family protein [Bacillota bacterium]NLU54917.1 TlpA family protein disulfide reductase [Bacillota bacterium]HOA91935.1 TlpA disulfide reductase family protein [Bacillota bacterium]HOJ45752.1 TlpA disulfide reductase family protein [Bacillota bacterium]HPT61941.1 TlpA disulfide reductase family protein [Bacillota bacterium]